MDRFISVRTPESIAFCYELAGLGSRFLALAADMALQLLILLGIGWAIVLIGSHASQVHGKPSVSESTIQSVAVAFVVTIVFVVFFGYFIAFEAFWNGQTPGKKMLGIRVVRDGGFPLDLAGSFIRNLIRIGEVGLGFYALSAICTLFSPENKRLGDMAAGTIVVRDTRVQALTVILDRSEPAERRTALLTDEEHAVIGRFIARRRGMDPQHRRVLAEQIADRVRGRVSRDLQGLDAEELLEKLSASS